MLVENESIYTESATQNKRYVGGGSPKSFHKREGSYSQNQGSSHFGLERLAHQCKIYG